MVAKPVPFIIHCTRAASGAGIEICIKVFHENTEGDTKRLLHQNQTKQNKCPPPPPR